MGGVDIDDSANFCRRFCRFQYRPILTEMGVPGVDRTNPNLGTKYDSHRFVKTLFSIYHILFHLDTITDIVREGLGAVGKLNK